MTNCLYCNTPLSRHEQFAGTICSNWRCREKHLENQLVSYRTEAAEALDFGQSETFPIAVVPHWEPKLVPLTHEDYRMLAEFLNGLISSETTETIPNEFMEAPPQSDTPPAMLSRLGQVCAICRGFCCFHGAAHNAFLDHKTLLRFVTEKPELELYDAVEIYLDYLPSQHYFNACLYQGEQGCTLPREMRANICNDYQCGGLRTARERFATNSDNRAFVVVRHDHKIQRAAFINGSSIIHYPPKDS
ncbi:hypothetical protein [Methylomonas albis]|uniref:Uncharacterized protein n=1 Tax=Methylomonas albis TaxID=1854563 RepID=A0ABR9D467_9GAMM|nr:hypothetical protein [Methylomonas albis]MBD9357898.1 hypothetical protein [Methylomonas albis]